MCIDDGEFILRLNALTEAALEAKDLDSMVRALAERMAAIIDADSCYITFWDAERGVVIPAAAYGPHSESYSDFEFLPGEQNLTRSIALADRTFVIEDALSSEHISPRISSALSARSFLGVPIEADDKVLGADRFSA